MSENGQKPDKITRFRKPLLIGIIVFLFPVWMLLLPVLFNFVFGFFHPVPILALVFVTILTIVAILLLTWRYYNNLEVQRTRIETWLDNHWKKASFSIIGAGWLYFLSGFSPTGFWLREASFYWILIAVIILLFIGHRLFLMRITNQKHYKPVSRYQLALLLLVTVFLLSASSLPYVQVNTVVTQVSSPELLEYNPISPLVPLTEDFSWQTFLLDYPTSNRPIKSVKNLPYNDFNKLDVFFIDDGRIHPVMIVIHGGGWTIESKNSRATKEVAVFMAQQGFTVFNIDYRLFPQANFTGMMSDVRDAVVFAKMNAASYFGDGNKTFLYGQSAGGHLALLAAYGIDHPYFREYCGNYTAEELKVSGVAAVYAISDLIAFEKEAGIFGAEHLINQLVGENLQEVPSLHAVFSPIAHVNRSGLPPTFISAGSLDALVQVTHSRNLHAALKEREVPNLYVEIPWANHAFDGFLKGPGGQVTMHFLLNFFSHFS
ncbi:MAG: alpha/beta hydrolase fold domain-containing protein [Candidatus Odinarchaeota archaeon]